MAFKRKRVRRGKQIINKLFPILLTKTHIAGGFARWVCSQNKTPIPASDIDIFCEDLATYYEMEGILNERFTFLSENEACRVFGTGWSKIKTIQLIKPREQHAVVTMGKIETILENFDFTITRAAIMTPKTVLVDEDFDKHERKRKLVIKNIHCPISSLFRVIKYVKKGYRFSMQESLKLFLDWEQRSPEYKQEIAELLVKENPTDEEIEHLEVLLRVD